MDNETRKMKVKTKLNRKIYFFFIFISFK